MCVQPPGNDYVAKGQSLFTKNREGEREKRERDRKSPVGSEYSNNRKPAT